MTDASLETPTGTNQPAEDIFPLWIGGEWYIPVNSEGQCVGVTGEGALGFIIQLRSTQHNEGFMALKIPRLLAETDRENAYISELLRQEMQTVSDVWTFEGGGIDGLLPPFERPNPIQEPVTLQRLEESKRWDRSLVLVRFEKGENPYFCLAKPGEDAPYPPHAKVPQIDERLLSELEAASEVQRPGEGSKTWSQMVLIEQAQGEQVGDTGHNGGRDTTSTQGQPDKEKQSQDKLGVFNVAQALSPKKEPGTATWYTGLPSIGYRWAPNTLQEAIGLGGRGGAWSLDKHLHLVERICNAIKALHDKKMLHADLRPANIVYTGNPESPDSYYVSDYGSFALTNVQFVQAPSPEPPDETIVGPVTQGERASVFYAPERGTRHERENADTAIVINPGKNVYFILVGWKSEFRGNHLLDAQGKPNKSADEFVDFIEQRKEQYKGAASDQTSTENLLHEGDRIQLRDYVFELAASEKALGTMQLFECSKLFWSVYHGRIMIREEKKFKGCYAFSIPRVVELLQWSAATDIFSIGALCLYSVYSDARHYSTNRSELQPRATYSKDDIGEGYLDNMSSEKDNAVNVGNLLQAEPNLSAGKARGGSDTSNGNPSAHLRTTLERTDEGFEAMMRYLADKSLFNAVWPKLEWLRHQIESKLDEKSGTPAELAQCKFEPHRVLHPDSLNKRAEGDEPKERTLLDETKEVVSQITATVPEIERLLRPLSRAEDRQAPALDPSPANEAEGQDAKAEYQLGPFIFFMHFVLRCLHREEDLAGKKDLINEGWMSVPFCTNRHASTEEGAVTKALDRLQKIRKLIEKDMLRGLKASNIASFDLRSETELRSELIRLKEEKVEWERNKTGWEQARAKWYEDEQQLKKQVQDLSDEMSALTKDLHELRPQVQEKAEELIAIKTGVREAFDILKTVSRRDLVVNRDKVIDDINRKFVAALGVPRPNPAMLSQEVEDEGAKDANERAG